MADVSNFGVGLSIDIRGAAEATRQAEKLGAAIDKVYDKTEKPIDFTVNTKNLDWDALFKKGEDKLNALKDAIRNLGRDARPPSNLRETLSELFPEDKAEAFFNKVQREYRDTGKLGGQMAATVRRAFMDMYSKMSAAQTAWADKTKDPALRSNLVTAAKDAEKAFTQLANNAIADLGKLEKTGVSVGNKIRSQLTLLRDNKVNPDKAYDSLEKSLLGMSSARYSASRTGAERIDAINAQKLAAQTAELEKQAALKAQMTEMDKIAAATLDQETQAAQQLSAKEQQVKEQAEQIAVEMSRIGQLAHNLTGSFRGISTTGVATLQESLKGTRETLRELAADAKTFRDLFGEETAKRVQKVREAAMRSQMATVNLKSLMLDENGMPSKSVMDEEVINATKQVNQANQQLLSAQKDLSNNLLKTITQSHDKLQAMVGVGQRFIEEEARATQYEMQRKEAIASILSSMQGGRAVVENQRRLQQQIVDIVRENGNMESAVLNKKLSELNIDKQRLEYAQRLLQASRELANGKQANNTRFAQYSLASESYGAARDAAMTANTKTTMSQALKGMREAGDIMAKMGAQDAFRDTISQVVTSISTGLVPSYDKVISAAQRFANVNKTAFADDRASIEILSQAVTALRNQYASLSGQSSGMAQRSKIVETMKILGSISSQGSSQQANDLTDRINRAVKEQEKLLERDKETAAAKKTITEQVDKLIMLQQVGVNTVGNERKLLDAVMEARRKNVQVEDILFAKLRDKKQLLQNIHNEILNTEAASKTMNFTAQSELILLQRKRDLYLAMRSAMTAANTSVSSVDVGPDTKNKITKKDLTSRIQALTQEIAQQEKQIANAQAFERQQNEIAKQLAARAAAEQKIVDIANRAVASVKDQKMQYDQLYQTARAYVTAIANGQDISGTRLSMVEAEKSALQSLLTSEQNLLGVMNNEKEAITARLVAAQKLQEVEQHIAQILASGRKYQVQVGDRQRVITSGYGEETHAQATDFITNNTAKLQREAQNAKQEFLSIKQAIELADEALKNGGAVMRMRNQLENDYAVKIKQSLEYILAGVDPFKNYVALQNQINNAAAAGLQIDKESLAVAQRKKEILAAVAAQVTQSLKNGLNSQDPVQAAVIAKSAKPRIDMLKESGFDTTKLEAALGRVEEKAGAQLASSFAAAKKNVDDTYASIQKMFSGLDYTKNAANDTGAVYKANLAVINRIIDAINKVKQAEQGVLNNADAINKMDSQSLIAQQEKLTKVEQLQNALKRVSSAQNTMNENLSKIGKGYTFSDTLTQNSVRDMGADAKSSKTSMYYVRAAEAANTLKAALKNVDDIIKSMPADAQAAFSKIQSSMQSLSTVANKSATEMSRISEAQKRLSQNDAGASMFDKFRIYWFMQLRAFWEMYTNVGQLITVITQYNQTLKTLQAVTQGTTRDVSAMATEFGNLTSEVPLALAAVSKAALDVAKAGFGVQDTLKIVQSASKLAVATQSDIATVADLQSVIVHAWHYSVDDIDKISNQLFNAVSKSRADINGLASAIGYISGIAPQANVPLDEALSVMSILTNAGFTMSKAGTYTRQFLNDLMNPSAKLQNVISSLGLTLADIDPRLNSLETIFKTLGAAGMNVADAFEGMSIRAASAFSVMLKNSKYIQQFTDAINEAGAVDTAFETASDTTAASFQLLVNAIVNLGQTIAELSDGTVRNFIDVLTEMVNGVNTFFDTINRNAILKTLISAILTVGATFLATKGAIKIFTSVWKGLLALPLLGPMAASIASVGTAAVASTGPLAALGAALRSLVMAHPALTALFAVGLVCINMFSEMGSEAAKTAEQMDKMKRATEDLKDAMKEGFQLRVDFEEASALGSKLTLAENEVNTNSAAKTPYEQRSVRGAMQNIAAAFRGSENSDLQAVGNQINKIIPQVGDSADAWANAIAKFKELSKDAQDIILKNQKDLKNFMQTSEQSVANTSAEIAASIAMVRAKIEAAGRNSTSSSLTKSLYGSNVDNDALTADRRKLADLDAIIMGGNMKGGLFANFKGFVGGVTDSEKEFSKWNSDLITGLKEIGLALTQDEQKMLNLARTGKEYKKVVAEILASKDEQLRTSGRAGFSDGDYSETVKGISNIAKSLSEMMQVPAESQAQLDTILRMVQEYGALIQSINKKGMSKDPALEGILNQWEAINKELDRYKKAAQANISASNSQVNSNPFEITKETADQWAKTQADAWKNATKELTALAGSTSKTDAFSQMFNVGDPEGAMRERIDRAVDKLGDVVADAQRKGPQLMSTMDAEAMNNLSTALKDFLKAVMKNSSGSNPLEKFLNGYQKVSEELQKRGVINPPDEAGLAKAVGLSKELADNFKLASQQDPFATVGENMEKFNKATAVIAEASSRGLMDTKDLAQVYKDFMTGQKNLQSIQTTLASTLTSSTRSLANYKVAAAGLNKISLDPENITAAAEAMDTLASTAEEVTARMEAVEDATIDVNNILKAYRQQMTALQEMPDSLMSLQTMETTADGLRKNLDLVKQQAKSLKDALASAKKEMLGIKLAAANDNLGFVQNYNEAMRKRYWRPDNSFLAAQENMNLQREFISKNMKFMDADSAISSLGSLRDAMVEFGANFPQQPRAQGLMEESKYLNQLIQEIYQAQYEKKEAEAALLQAWQNDMLNVGEQMTDYLAKILDELQKRRGDIADVPYTRLPAMQPGERPGRYQVGTDVGALSRKYESGGKDSKAIGYDDKGGTSYGTYQIASRPGTMDRFLRFLEKFDNELYTKLTSLAQQKAIEKEGNPNAKVQWNAGNKKEYEPGAFAWQQTVLNNPERMRKAEETFIADTHFAPALETYMKASGTALEDISLAVQQALYSTGVQHGAGGQRGLVESAVGGARGADGKIDEAQFLKNLYAGRSRAMPSTASRYKDELADALRQLQTGGAASTQQNTGKNPEQLPVQQQALDLSTAAVKEAEAMQSAAKELAALQEEYKKLLEGTSSQSTSTTGPSMTGAVATGVYDEEAIAGMAKKVEDATKAYFAAVVAYSQKLTTLAMNQPVPSNVPVKTPNTPVQQPAKQEQPQVKVQIAAQGTAATAAVKTSASTKQYTTALDGQTKATENLNAKVKEAIKVAGDLKRVDQSVDVQWTGENGVADNYLQGWEGNAMQYSYELFTNEVNTMKSGLANIFTTSVRDAINEREDWQEAAWDMIYNMIDAWVNQLMNNFINSLIASTMKGTAANSWGWLGFGNEGANIGGSTGAMGVHTGGYIGAGVVYRHLGGIIPAFAGGGMVTQGNRQADSTMAMLTKGEFVIQEPTVRKYGVEFMRKLNEGNIGEVQKALGDFGITQNYKSQSFTGADAQGRTNASGNGGQTATGGRRDKQQMNIVNVSDPQDVGRFLATPRGERMVLNIMNKSSRRSRGSY